MNCANHPGRERTAFCQSCGKPLCTECARAVGSSVFCEPCLAARAGVPPGYMPVDTGVPPAGGSPSAWGSDEWMAQRLTAPGPNPVLAALLGFIPGVGAMYNGQYAKGIVHLIVFALLVSLANENSVFGLFVMGWIFYMVIEAHHTARARRDGTPLPNPFGLNDVGERLGFGKGWTPAGNRSGADSGNPAGQPSTAGTQPPGQQPPYTQTHVPPAPGWDYPPIPPVPPMPPTPYQPGIPTGAIFLIVLGVLFLLGNSGWLFFRARYVAPMLIIALGVWIFLHRMTSTGGLTDDGTPYYRYRLGMALHAATWMILIGVLLLVNNLGVFTFGHSWPLFLIVGGLLLLYRRSAEGGYIDGPPYPPAPPTVPPARPPQTQPTTTAIIPSDPANRREDR